jgi:single-stranded-DNA-specific exonuclease
VRAENAHLLADALSSAHLELGGGQSEEVRFADALLSTDELNWRLFDEIQKLAPFGIGNERPLFIFDSVVPLQVRWFGKNEEHVELLLPRKVGSPVVAIGFFMRTEAERKGVATGTPVTLAASLEKDQWKPGGALRLRITDFTELAH